MMLRSKVDNSLYTHRLDYVPLHAACSLVVIHSQEEKQQIRFLFAIALRSVVNAET